MVSGLTVMGVPVCGAGVPVHAYKVPPVADKEVEDPRQTPAGLASALIGGRGFTVTVAVAEPTQPLVLVPVTV